MASALDQIVNVSIDLNMPPKDQKSFGIVLLVGPPPSTRYNSDGTFIENDIPPVGTYRGVEELESDGFAATGEQADPIGAGARIGFSQNPRPEHVMTAIQQRVAFDANTNACVVMDDITGLLGGATEPDPASGPFLVAKYPTPAGPETATVTRGGSPFPGAVSITSGGVQYCIVPLLGEETSTFVFGIPESVSAQGGVVRLRYAARWDADAQSVTSIQTVNGSDFEPISDTLNRAMDEGGWYGIAECGIDPGTHEQIMQWTEAQEAVATFPITSLDGLKSIYFRSFGIAPESDFEDNRYIHVAYICRFLAYQPGSTTWVHKSLAGIEPSRITGTRVAALEKANVSYYITVAGQGNVLGGKVLAGEWIDNIHFRDWLKNDIQLRVFTLLRVNPKLPYTDAGIALVQAQIEASLEQGQRYGGIATTEYNGDGDEIPGFSVKVPLAASIPAYQKASRVLKDVSFWARLASAIHAVKIIGALVYDAPATS